VFTPPGRNLPVVLVFHGGGKLERGDRIAKALDFDRRAAQERFIAVYPNGVFGRFDAGTCCSAIRAHDLGFVDRIIRDLNRRPAADVRRVFATGFSNGGFMVYTLACRRSNAVRAVAAVAATEVVSPCRPHRPVSVLHIHALDDRQVRFDGRGFPGGPSVSQLFERWRSRNGCRQEAPPDKLFDATRRRWGACRSATRVELIALATGGHRWPGASPPYGNGPEAIDATSVVLRFFGLGSPRPDDVEEPA